MKSLNSKGITLLEIIIVLVVLVILVAVMLPVILPPHEYRYTSTSQKNLKQCAVALQLYWSDYDGHLPSSALVRHSKKWNKQDFMTFATKAGNLPPKESAPLQTWPELLYLYTYLSKITFRRIS